MVVLLYQTSVIILSAVVIAVVAMKWHWMSPRLVITFRGGKYPIFPHRSSHRIRVTDAEKELYNRDGYILKKGLIQGDELDVLVRSAEEIYSNSNASPGGYYNSLSFELWRKRDEYAQLAFETLPVVAAELLGYDDDNAFSTKHTGKMHQIPTNQTIRILRDGFFGFDSKRDKGCGFHVDDAYFWPAADDSTGVTFWIAMTPMRVTEGGGIRVVNQSQVEESVFEECRKAIGVTSPRTCHMETVSPECHKKMFDSSAAFDMEPGDALIWDRWTFHASEPFRAEHPEGQHRAEDGKDDEYRLRYSIRYIPGTAKASGMHHKSQKTGEVYSSSYHPRVWPWAETSEIDAIQRGLA